jgi:NADH:ubiquinone oxidoreductase subunit E
MEILICVGSACHLKGAEDVIKTIERLVAKEKINDKLAVKKVLLKGSFCQGKCAENGVTITIGSNYYKAGPQEAEKFFYDVIVPLVQN